MTGPGQYHRGMALRRFGTFTGGIDLHDDKEATLDAAIVPIGLLERLCVPLAMVDAPPARMVVQVGQAVAQGERLAAGDGEQVDVFAPLAGKVAGLGRVRLPAAGGAWRNAPAVVLTETAEPAPLRPLPDGYEWQAADAASLRHRIAEGGLTTFRDPVVSLAGWIDRAGEAGADILIANFLENTPFITADHRLLTEHGSEVIRGLAILARATGITQVFLAADARWTGGYRAAVGPSRLYGIEPFEMSHKYPIGADAIVTRVLTRRTVEPGQRPLDVRVAITDAATCWAAYRWVACGERVAGRVVTVSGAAVGRPGNYLVPFGAACAEVLALAEAEPDQPAVYGSAMNGRQVVENATVGPACNGLLAPRAPELGQPTPCIRCGWCVDNCPARLNVSGLNDDFELGRVERAHRRGALACVDCGICSYVCPARLPLTHRVGMLKAAIRAENGRMEQNNHLCRDEHR